MGILRQDTVFDLMFYISAQQFGHLIVYACMFLQYKNSQRLPKETRLPQALFTEKQ